MRTVGLGAKKSKESASDAKMKKENKALTAKVAELETANAELQEKVAELEAEKK